VVFNVVVPQYSAYLGNVQSPMAKCHTVRHVQAPGDGDNLIDFVVLVVVQDRVNISRSSSTHEQSPPGAQDHGACIGHIICIEIDAEALGKIDLFQVVILARVGNATGKNEIRKA